jgi:FkbM family methyltransferase
MNPLKLVRQPEYFYRPAQVFRKLGRTFGKHAPLEEVLLPWGARIRICPDEHIGARIWHRGVFDLTVLEAIARLAEPGETALDIGANIGQMTTLMSTRVGASGAVHSFEPHPEVFKLLSANVTALKQNPSCAPVHLHNIALSDFEGHAFLAAGTAWSRNQGLACLITRDSAESNGNEENKVEVPVTTLDEAVGPDFNAGFCKLDVEGHELSVLHGAAQLVKNRRIRDIVFEDLGPYPGPVQQHLIDAGYTLFALHTRLGGPVLDPEWSTSDFNGDREGADFLATLSPGRAHSKYQMRGWRALK